MRLAKFFIRYALFYLLIFPQIVDATVLEKKCGEMVFIVEIYNGFDVFEKNYKLYYKEKSKKKKLFFKTMKGVILNASCVKDKSGKELFLFLENGGGNAAPEDRYTIFSPNLKKIIIRPKGWDKGNYEEIEKLIGYNPPFPIYDGKDETFFCCFNIQNHD